MDRARTALSVLEEYGWVNLAERPPGPGRFAERWTVHPKVRRSMEQYPAGMAIVRHSAPVIPISAEPEPAFDAPPLEDDAFYDGENEHVQDRDVQ